MSTKTGTVPVLVAPAMLDPGRGRIDTWVPPGETIAEIIDLVLPDKALPRHLIRVALVAPTGGTQIIPERYWHRVRPHAGVRVVIRVVPGKDFLKTILQVVVAVAAVAIGAYFAPALAGTLGIGQAGWQGIIGLGVTIAGNLLINALIPPPKPEDQKQQNRYSISGWQNAIEQDGAIPVVMGTIRVAPVFAALSYTEVVGDFLYNRAFFNFGHGELELDDFRIGETSLADYDEVEIEVRNGVEGDLPCTLFAKQRVEQPVNADLTRPYPRDDLGEIIEDSEAVETPVIRSTGPDASGACIIIAMPGGCFATTDEGKLRRTGVDIKIQQRPADGDEWQDVVTLNIRARQREAIYRSHEWKFPTRGSWQVSVIMLTPEVTDLRVSVRAAWAALQTIRPEYPINFPKPLCLVAVRVKATHQLAGQLDSFNALASRVCLDYEHTTGNWIKRKTSNPASLKRFALQSLANPRRVSDDGIDLPQLQDWHDFCRLKDLKYDRILNDPNMGLGDALAEIASAGRASPRHDGRKWGVVVDRPQDLLLVDDFSPRNSSGFQLSRSYIRPPDGIRVKFFDKTNDYKPTERVVPWPGHEGDIVLTEAMEHPGKTDPDEIFRETTRRMLETIHRPDVYRVSQDLPTGVATRGDKVTLSADTLDRTQTAARVRSSSGRLVELDDVVEMEADENYAIRFRVFDDEDDTIGTSIVRPVVRSVGETRLLQLASDGPLPPAGSLVHFGIAGRESYQVIVSGVEAGQDFSRHFKMIAAAPIIDEIIDALEIPEWLGRIGAELPASLLLPPAPRFVSIVSGVEGTDETGLVSYQIEPGSGAVISAEFRIEHRLVGAPSWTPITIPAGNGGGDIAGYANGDAVQIRALATSPDEIDGPYCDVIPFTVGEGDAAIPGALDDTMITVGALLGGAVVQFSTTDEATTSLVQIYRSMSGTLDRVADAVGAPIAVSPSRSYSQPLGDTTRQNLVINGNMDAAGTWALGVGWAITGGKASHSGGTTGALTQALAAVSGKYYRTAFTLSGVSAGTLAPRLTGGTTRTGTVRSADGNYSDRIQAVTGNNTFGLNASGAFVGSVDDVVVYLETATCLTQGVHYIWLEPQNEDGVPGPVSGPFTVTIR